MLKQKIYDAICKMEIDVTDLESCRYEKDPYCVGYPLSIGSGCFEYDGEEYWQAQKKQFMEYIKEDGLYNYIDLPDNAAERDFATGRLKNAVLKWLEGE